MRRAVVRLAVRAGCLGLASTVLSAWTLSYLAANDPAQGHEEHRVHSFLWRGQGGAPDALAMITEYRWPGLWHLNVVSFDPADAWAPKSPFFAHDPPAWALGHLERVARAFPPADAQRMWWGVQVSRPPDQINHLVVAAGWPLPAVWCHARAAAPRWPGPGVGRVETGGWVAPTWTRADQPAWIAQLDRKAPLPWRPIWRGLAVNTAIFAAAWAPLLVFPGAIRRAHRRRRGLCPRCGYDLRALPEGAPCPECGRPGLSRPARPRRSGC